MKIEVLYFEGCPNFRPAVERLKAVLREGRVAADIDEIEIKDEAAARRCRFPGSPTIRINGLDVDTSARKGGAFAFACRQYEGGIPSETMLRRALWEAREGASDG